MCYGLSLYNEKDQPSLILMVSYVLSSLYSSISVYNISWISFYFGSSWSKNIVSSILLVKFTVRWLSLSEICYWMMACLSLQILSPSFSLPTLGYTLTICALCGKIKYLKHMFWFCNNPWPRIWQKSCAANSVGQYVTYTNFNNILCLRRH